MREISGVQHRFNRQRSNLMDRMQDEGDMLAPRPLTVRQLVVRLLMATALFYALLTAALVLLPRG